MRPQGDGTAIGSVLTSDAQRMADVASGVTWRLEGPDDAGPCGGTPQCGGTPAVRRVSDNTTAVTLREITDGNREAAKYPHAKPWYRAVYAGDEPVGFVMLSWNVQPQPPDIVGPWFLWKLLIDERHQGRGHALAAVRQIAQLVRAECATELLTSYVPEDGGPAGFYERAGFVPTGELDGDGEVIMRLVL